MYEDVAFTNFHFSMIFKGLSETFNEFSKRFRIGTLQIHLGKQIPFTTQKCGGNTLLKRHMKTSHVTLLLFFSFGYWIKKGLF